MSNTDPSSVEPPARLGADPIMEQVFQVIEARGDVDRPDLEAALESGELCDPAALYENHLAPAIDAIEEEIRGSAASATGSGEGGPMTDRLKGDDAEFDAPERRQANSPRYAVILPEEGCAYSLADPAGALLQHPMSTDGSVLIPDPGDPDHLSGAVDFERAFADPAEAEPVRRIEQSLRVLAATARSDRREFALRIELGRPTMTARADVARALRALAERLEAGASEGAVLDAERREVGEFVALGASW